MSNDERRSRSFHASTILLWAAAVKEARPNAMLARPSTGAAASIGHRRRLAFTALVSVRGLLCWRGLACCAGSVGRVMCESLVLGAADSCRPR